MMRKKHIETKELSNKEKSTTIENRKAKVTVQYIQEQQQLIQKPENPNHHMIHAVAASEDLEIENVEYLEENPNVDEYIEDRSEKDEFEDNFYPNAIHCLLDLYKSKYENLNMGEPDFKVSQVWRDIAKDMQESFFDFNERNIQHKYALLREQYFGVQTKEDIDNFDYFEQLHDIYKVIDKENIVKGLMGAKTDSNYYKDETLLNTMHLDNNDVHCHDFKSEEIVHKEHEFIDMVEKELQAMEDGVHIEETKETTDDSNHINNNKPSSDTNTANEVKQERFEDQSKKLKRVLTATTETEQPPNRKQKFNNQFFEINEIIEEPSFPNGSNFTLYHYNQQQEKRHREKISMLEKSLKIQERALEQQQQLLHQLIKRLPS